MDGLSAAVTVGTAVELSGKILKSCYEYLHKAKNARKDIERLRKEVLAFQDAANAYQALPQGPQKEKLALSEPVITSLLQCIDDLKDLKLKLRPETMRKFGIRSPRIGRVKMQ